MTEGWRRLGIGFTLVAGAVAAGSVGYHLIGRLHGEYWSPADCVYMTVITLSTVGYGEILPIREVPGARAFTIFLIMFGMGTLLYFASTFVALVVEFNVKEVMKRRARSRAVKNLRDHIIVCGAGTTGIHVIEELQSTQVPFVVVETDAERIQWLGDHIGPSLLYVQGDATDDEVLTQAAIQQARGVVAALASDKDNLFVTVTARQLNARLRIVSRAREASSANKLKRAGADAVVSPNLIGGLRMVSEMIRPEVVQFLDIMLRDKDKTLRIEEAIVPTGSVVVGKTLAEARLRKVSQALVIAVRSPDGKYQYHPGPEYVLKEGAVLILLGGMNDVRRLREHL